MSFPQAQEPGGPSPGHGPGHRRPPDHMRPPDSGMRHPDRRWPPDSGMGVASLACGALILPSMMVMVFPAALVSLFTRPDHGRSGREWVASTVFFCPPVSLTLFSLLLGVLALWRTRRGSMGYRTGAIGLTVTAVVAVFVLVPALLRGY